MTQINNFENLYGFESSAMSTQTFFCKKTFLKSIIKKCHFFLRICHTKAQSTSLYYSGCSVFERLVTFECVEQF
jgi:hypothetical protein